MTGWRPAPGLVALFFENGFCGNPAAGLPRMFETPESADSQKLGSEPERFFTETLVMLKQKPDGKVVKTSMKHLNLCV